MAVPSVNITIEQGVDYENSFTITNPDGSPIDLSGYTSIAKIKKFHGSTTSYPFSVGIVTSAGQVVVSMANTITNSIVPGRYYYDIVITSLSNNKKQRIIEGMALVTPSVSV